MAGTPRANLDLVLIGPPGVFILDVKNWRDVRIEKGSLWRGDELEDRQLSKGRDMADSVASVLTRVGLAPGAVRPFIVMANGKDAAIELDGVTVVGERALQRELIRYGPRLTAKQVNALVAAVHQSCPPASAPRPVPPEPPEPQVRRQGATKTKQDTQAEILTVDELWAAAEEAATRGPIEQWMTSLHPSQAHLAARTYNGPARIEGAAGTGKTVVALHRAAMLARDSHARILFTSYVKTLPNVYRSLFERLAPRELGRVEFRSLNSFAAGVLRTRGIECQIAPDGAREAFRMPGLEWANTRASAT